MKASEETVTLIREGMVEMDRLCRYYGYLIGRMDRIGDLLPFCVLVFSLGALATFREQLPVWVPLAASALPAATAILAIRRRYHEKASRALETYRRLVRLDTEWEKLWRGVGRTDDAELRAAWEELTRRQVAIVERARRELPFSRLLARRSERESNGF